MDAAKFVSFYTEDAVVMMAGAPDISGMPAIRDRPHDAPLSDPPAAPPQP